jgi:hypothetical protein
VVQPDEEQLKIPSIAGKKLIHDTSMPAFDKSEKHTALINALQKSSWTRKPD